MMRELCGLPINTHKDGSRFKIWPHQFPQICAVSPSLCPPPDDWPEQKNYEWLVVSRQQKPLCASSRAY